MLQKITLLVLLLLILSCSTLMVPSDQPKHRFENNHITHPDKSFWSFWKMRLFGDDVWADPDDFEGLLKVIKTKPSQLNADPNIAQVTWIGHSTFLIQYRGISVLTDPIFSMRASPVSFAGPKRMVELPLSFESLPKIDFVVISHNHYDHLDKPTINLLGNQPTYFVPLALSTWFLEQEIEKIHVKEMAWWEKQTVQTNSKNKGSVTITALPSQHWSSRSLTDRNRTHWASWLVKIDDFTLWFAGDTGYNEHDFKQIGQQMDNIDLALIPIGAYAPRHFMKSYHVNVEEAIQIHHDIKAKHSIGMHWGTFPLTAEPYTEPPQKLIELTTKQTVTNFTTMTIGETRYF